MRLAAWCAVLAAMALGLSNGFAAAPGEMRSAIDAGRCPPVAFIKRQAGGLNGTNATMHARRTGVGSAICVYDPATPEKPARTLFEDRQGFIFDLSPSSDAKKLLFTYKKDAARGTDPFHIYEISIDGTGLRQLTTGRYHDFSPQYLPDGRIVFNSTRVESFSLCQDFIAAALYTMDGDGRNLRRIEYNTLCDTTPWVMDDGSILFGRWEYQDKNIFCVQGLWTIQPNGTQLRLFYGNTLTIPNSIYGAKQVPGSSKVVCVMAAHHFPPIGGIALIDRKLGLEEPEGMKCLTPEVPYRPTVGKTWRDTNWGPGDKFYEWSYTDPWPLAEDLFLVSYGGPLEDGPKRFRLFLLNDQGQKVLLYDDPATSCYNPVALSPRPLPAALPGDVPEPRGEGTFYVLDIYQGLLDKGVNRGDVKELRILSQTAKKYNTEGPRYHDHYPVIGYGSYYVKVDLGTVPVAPEGTAYFKAPAGVELYFEAIDPAGKEIRRMGSVTQITAGERQGCIGCHESRFSTPGNYQDAMKRLSRPPDAIAPPPWGVGPVSFVKQVQPVLDQYCVKCHEGRNPPKGIDLSGDKTRLFSMAYETLTFKKKLVDYYYINQGPTGNFPPLQSGARVSKLTKLIEERHSGVDMDDAGRRRIYAWIDANAPYYDTWDMSRPHSLGGRDAWSVPGEGKPKIAPWFESFRGVFDAQCASCHARDKRTDFDGTWINLTRPEFSRALNAHLSNDAGGMGIDKPRDGRRAPVFPSTVDGVYQQLLRAVEEGKRALDKHPRMDMPGGTAIPQQRDFGRTY